MQDLAVIQRARRLRKSTTLPELVLWRHLRDKQIGGLRFRRQVPIGRYVVDFASLLIRLIVEVDGGVHDLRTFDDAKRDAWLRSQGFRVIRFTNAQVRDQINDVLAEIRKHAPSPISGGSCQAEPDGWGLPDPERLSPARLMTHPHPSRSASHLPPKMAEGSD